MWAEPWVRHATAFAVLSYRAFTTLSELQPPAFCRHQDGQLGRALCRTAITQSDCVQTSRRGTERAAGPGQL